MTTTDPTTHETADPTTGDNRSGLVGQSVQRVEDDRLLRGDGRYVHRGNR